jgi:formylglycine-generating enzyme required for sulfatase activity
LYALQPKRSEQVSNDDMTAGDDVEISNNPAILRAEVVRLRAELKRARQAREPERNVDSITDRLALQQEVETLRRSVREKERVVDVTAAQCRRLEDELEDQHLAYDGLKQDLERKKESLTAAREQAARLSKERQEIEERYQALVESGGSPGSGSRSSSMSDAARRLRAAFQGRQFTTFLAGLVVGVVSIAFAAFILVGSGVLPLSGLDRRVADQPLQPLPEDQDAESTVPSGAGNGQAVGEDFAIAEAVSAAPEVALTVRDRLRDGTFGPLLASIAGGRFTMGKLGALPTDDRAPAHRVTLAPYLVGASEVTFEEYDRFVRATGGRFPDDFGWGRGRRPVVDVSWADAMSYTEWLSAQTGQRYRLPTEAEWEYAAAAGQRTTYWWGYGLEAGRAVCFECGTMWDNRSTAPTGTFEPNPLGLYDTAGNAMEWVADCYRPNYKDAPEDGAAWDAEDCRYRVARGGAFNKPARSMASTARHRFDPATRLNMLGFRLARDE